MRLFLDELATEYGEGLVIAKVNTDENSQYAMQYGVQGIPTLLLVSGGQEVDRVVGAMPKQSLKARIEGSLSPVAG